MSQIDIEKLCERVFQEFQILKATKEKLPGEQIENNPPKKLGCLFLPFAKVANAFVDTLIQRERKNRKHLENEQHAATLLTQNEVKSVICGGLESFSKKDILTEKKFVRTVTLSLFKGLANGKFTMPLEPILFAAIAHQISDQGIEQFCENVGDE